MAADARTAPGSAFAAVPDADGSRWPAILIILGAGIVSAFQVGKAPMALTTIQSDLGLDLATASWLLSAFAIVGALISIAIGVSVDRIGARRMAIVGLLLQGICSALGAFAAGSALLITTRVVEGIGFLAVAVAAPTLITAVARPAERERAFAAWATFMPVGITLVMLGAPLLTVLGWRGFWLLNAAILIAYAGLLARQTDKDTPNKGSRRLLDDMRITLAARGPWLLAALFGVYVSMYFAVFGFLPRILAARMAIDESSASMLTALAVGAGAVGCLLCGQLLARGARPLWVLLGSFAAMALCGFGIFSDGVPGSAAYLLAIVLSFIGAFIPVVLIDGVPRHAPRPELIGTTMGFLIQGNNAGLVIGPAAAGAIAEASGWPAVSLLVAGFAAVGLALSFGVLARGQQSGNTTQSTSF
jgi:MFS transporter, DHA1 family, inner membrane transport protein